ncbi:MAG: hypothetical protein PHN56_05095 [Candidatus Nanoarchaeia archaeon]|nr:hypothetical protein [Candidatus Nanoarchaeia archaeon]
MITGLIEDGGKEYLIQKDGFDKTCRLCAFYNCLIDLGLVSLQYAEKRVEELSNNFDSNLNLIDKNLYPESSIKNKSIKYSEMPKLAEIEKGIKMEKKEFENIKGLELILADIDEKGGNLIINYSGHASMIREYNPAAKIAIVIDSTSAQKIKYTVSQLFHQIKDLDEKNSFFYLVRKK